MRSIIAMVALFMTKPSLADPFQPFNKPVAISWWKGSCFDAYVRNGGEQVYSRGYCHGVMLAYMNEFDEWCVPSDVTWSEVQDYIAMTVVEANIDALSQINIGEWIQSAISVKWPCDDAVDKSAVTDPELIRELNELSRQSREQ